VELIRNTRIPVQILLPDSNKTDHPDRWSGAIAAPPIRVIFYRMKGWSLFG